MEIPSTARNSAVPRRSASTEKSSGMTRLPCTRGAFVRGSPVRRTSFVCLLATLSLIGAIKLNSQASQSAAEAGGRIEFIENQGQWERGVRFLARRGSATAVVEQGTLTLRPAAHPEAAVSLSFEGASPAAVILGEGKRATHYN